MPESPEGGWPALLAEMEACLVAAEAEPRPDGFAAEPVWTPPDSIGPLPVELAERARAIVRAQAATIALIEDRRRQIGRHLVALRSIPLAGDGGRPSYLDTMS
ncbi:MAG TPA: hypothetical protein VGC18_04780 [Lacisediminihabitans sp.]|uniref:hypothetical protein n=1 Tax=Lacisediminihabitans sp. TaxID=2787631 RepID=UPI002ED92AF1